MKTTVVGAVAAAIATTAAMAADVPRGMGPYTTAPVPYAVYGWLGPYLGFNAGYQWGSVTNGGTEVTGLMGGIQGGYSWQTGRFVYGFETDLQLSGADGTFAAYKFSNPWFGTVRGRAGFAMNNILFYGTLGLAYGRGRVETAALSETKLHVGWAAGAGLEVGLTPNWSAKAEYLFVDLAEEHYGLTGVNNGFESSLLRFGVNYRF
jgi:outer membrane immunogenic protein